MADDDIRNMEGLIERYKCNLPEAQVESTEQNIPMVSITQSRRQHDMHISTVVSNRFTELFMHTNGIYI